MLDGVESETLDKITHAAAHVTRIEEVTDVSARWIGHRLHADVSVTMPPGLSVAEGHDIARDVRQQQLHNLPHLGSVMVPRDPYGRGGEHHHRVGSHSPDDLPMHAHE